MPCVLGAMSARWDAKFIDKHHGERDRYHGPGYMRRCVSYRHEFCLPASALVGE